jgi:hypothetical protein
MRLTPQTQMAGAQTVTIDEGVDRGIASRFSCKQPSVYAQD